MVVLLPFHFLTQVAPIEISGTSSQHLSSGTVHATISIVCICTKIHVCLVAFEWILHSVNTNSCKSFEIMQISIPWFTATM